MTQNFKTIALTLLLLAGCSQPNDSNKKAEKTSDLLESEKDYKGYLRVDLDKIMLYSKTIEIYNSDKTLYAEIVGDTLLVRGRKYNLIEDRRDTLRRYITSYSFDPEYDIFILQCDGILDGYYKVQLNEGFKLISTENRYTKFETLEEFVLSSLPDISSGKTPLRREPNDQASIIDGYDEFYYRATKMSGDWIFLECDVDYADCDKGKDSGWVKWRDSTGVIIRLAQTY